MSLCTPRKRRWWGKAPHPGRFTHTKSTRGTHWIDLVEPWSRFERFREVLHLPVIELRYLRCSASSLGTTPTTLARLWLTAINRNTGTLLDMIREKCVEASKENTGFPSSAFCSISQQVYRFCTQHFKPLLTEGLACEQPAGLDYDSARHTTIRIEFWPVIRNYRNGTGTHRDSWSTLTHLFQLKWLYLWWGLSII
jgi:hypothetical protein